MIQSVNKGVDRFRLNGDTYPAIVFSRLADQPEA